MKEKIKQKSFLRERAEAIAIAVVPVFILRTVLFSLSVPVEPTILIGNHILENK